ncbi:hypothetical protein [Nocardioides albus]|uniref:Anti-sigma factor RsiW n=1 Tax=Nocardioides albus TaxID=1841 RepID=A0A7W5F9J0_9ACTN|nr:hypothetical protein [Nocardioides albus]MBB3090354.1 anti-sigma factor RsiW [Nocardioides albus]GGU29511.1 hypothetical protein GCM10007979_30650 [Nocardioides albus]
MSLLGNHLGARISALLDGQLDAAEEERAWAHVHECCACRRSVEREGWLKRRLAGLSVDPGVSAPADLKGSLRGGVLAASVWPGDDLSEVYSDPRSMRRTLVMVAAGGGAVGAAVFGMFAFAAAPADAPVPRNLPVTAVTQVPGSPGAPVIAHVRR